VLKHARAGAVEFPSGVNTSFRAIFTASLKAHGAILKTKLDRVIPAFPARGETRMEGGGGGGGGGGGPCGGVGGTGGFLLGRGPRRGHTRGGEGGLARGRSNRRRRRRRRRRRHRRRNRIDRDGIGFRDPSRLNHNKPACRKSGDTRARLARSRGVRRFYFERTCDSPRTLLGDRCAVNKLLAGSSALR